jgi:hypothetical protein
VGRNGGSFSDDFNLKTGDLLSRPLSPATHQPCARPLMLTRPFQAHTCMFARAHVNAYVPTKRAHKFLLTRDTVHACARLTRAPAVSLRAANACAPVTREQKVQTLPPQSLYVKSSQVNILPKAECQAKDKRAKDRQKYAALS